MQAPPPPQTELAKLRILSSTSGLRVSPLQLGAMSLGSKWGRVLGDITKEEAFKLLDAYVEAGGNFIDTANAYQNEESEKWLGEWMAARQNRDQLVIATKYSMDYKSHELGFGRTANHTGNHRRSLHMSVRDSLAKLQTDYIDILYVHVWDYTTSIAEVVDSLHALVMDHKVLYLGISDTPAWVVSAANTYAAAHGRTPFSIYQGRWNALAREFERDILPMARTFGMALAPFDVVGGGRFAAPARLREKRAAGDTVRSFGGPRGMLGDEQADVEVRMSEALGQVAAEHSIESRTAVAIAYVMSKAPNVFPIVGGRKIEYLHDNIQALKIRLTAEQIKQLESVQEFDVGFPGLYTGPDPNLAGHSTSLASSAHVEFPNAWSQRN
jgi:aryl-alcohol dehydrogenase-like predicted oxidoreductase